MEHGTDDPAKTSGQGQGNGTFDKERCIGSALSVSAQVASVPKLHGRPYWHLDCNAGSGWNETVDCPGSPLVFHHIAAERLHNMRVHSLFAEMNPALSAALERRFVDMPFRGVREIHAGDNAAAMESFVAAIRRSGDRAKYAVGSVIIDPNGWFYRKPNCEGAPIKEAIAFFQAFPRIDVILNINARTYRLMKGHPAGMYPGLLPPLEIFAALNKRHWLVKLTKPGRDSFLLAVGRNIKAGEHKGLGLHYADSEQGRAVIEEVEGKRQQLLNFAS
jgi:hypothetical protein